VTLRSDDGDGGRQRQTSIAALMRHRDCRASSRSSQRAAERGRQPATWKDLTGQQQRLVELRLTHLLEAETGFRSGDPFRPAPGEPRPEYDPALVPLVTARRDAKVAELAAMREQEPQHARLLGLDRISLRTLERWTARYYRWGVMGCAPSPPRRLPAPI